MTAFFSSGVIPVSSFKFFNCAAIYGLIPHYF